MKCFLIVVLIVIVIILSFFIHRVLPLLTAKPAIKIDYVAEYNKITRPADYTPADNAAPYYQKAFDALVKIPEALKANLNTWPGDMNESQFNTMKTWLESNSRTLDYLSQAVKKPYCWIERHGTDNAIFNIELPEVSKFRNGAWALNMQAKLNAYQGQYELAFNQIIELHQMGFHFSGPVTLVEQLVGLAVRGMAFNTAFSVIDKTEINPGILTDFQIRLERQIQKSKPLNFTIGEGIYGLDITQRMFTDNGKDDGFLIPAKLFEIKKTSWITPPISFVRAVLICLNHPGRKDSVMQYKKLYEELDKIIYKTPWQLRKDGTGYQDYVQKLAKGNYLLSDSAYSLGRICEIYWRQKISGEALVTSLALLRYKADKGSFPASLQELVSFNYVEKLPMDPYSDRPLIYKKTDGNFELYSVGADFEDNGGKPADLDETEQGGDWVFWPLRK
jgi:hypothetical protein